MACPTCKQLSGLAVTFGRVVSYGIQTGIIMNKLLAEQRMIACRKCEFYDAQGNRCKECGCYLSIKAPLVAAKCDKGKWTT